jgi:hypothetical protein
VNSRVLAREGWTLRTAWGCRGDTEEEDEPEPELVVYDVRADALLVTGGVSTTGGLPG